MESADRYTQDKSTISSLGVSAHGIDLYNKEVDDNFYNSYLPQVANEFGEGIYVTPKDKGALFINFALQPGILQPTGHINISRAREFYLHI